MWSTRRQTHCLWELDRKSATWIVDGQKSPEFDDVNYNMAACKINGWSILVYQFILYGLQLMAVIIQSKWFLGHLLSMDAWCFNWSSRWSYAHPTIWWALTRLLIYTLRTTDLWVVLWTAFQLNEFRFRRRIMPMIHDHWNYWVLIHPRFERSWPLPPLFFFSFVFLLLKICIVGSSNSFLFLFLAFPSTMRTIYQ